ncbi:MAG: peptidyl-prolyl cis-trans isomerase [Gammaproteobacteria bacterium]|nr:peptidyl-prolyl cis-trans isomerase [Gammaproteobacteria bacterium]NND39417.1 peptidyl-prolyl cis-trans isomerase [Pseudomonadales bacterium]NNL10513.1 peptidyl-prolyl cis-trans isomerase [Pseudomonadales bacterium]NNM10757.1 peptidyl-prolyl cis-trans isomerase [Pseudomonadales bacterium]RZV57432.1 MAG: peptidyl-prolyl cis-trans isomerase [Pseudomonadales bacterium]
MESAKNLLSGDDATNDGEGSKDRVAVVMQTSMGDIELSLDQGKAPQSVANFLRYADEGFYNKTIFHRVIDGFMIQGGGFTEDMLKKPVAAPIQNEADNGLLNVTGSIAMARTGAPHSATSQFFINVVDNARLNHRGKSPALWGYTVFGEVTAGMDVVNAIKAVPTTNKAGYANVPVDAVVIQRVYRKP